MNARVAAPPGLDLRIAALLGAAGAISVVAVFPYLMTLIPADRRVGLPPLWLLLPLQSLQALVVFTLLGWIGLRLGAPLGLDAPRLRAWIAGEPRELPAFPWRRVLESGALACLIVLALQAMFVPMLPHPIAAMPPQPTPLQGFFASFYGGIAEELQLRLFLMTLVAAALVRYSRASRLRALAIANVVAALAFGAGHLPVAAGIWPLDAVVVVYIVGANAAAGVVFGALYARHGLEAAIAAHFAADLGLHVVAPLFIA